MALAKSSVVLELATDREALRLQRPLPVVLGLILLSGENSPCGLKQLS